ncbi:MAG TPA: hypothetical protein VEV83_08220 [Parafilimonas sp.]|nr:hypothetical protein [Parafilimonas sp.]
MKSNTVRGILVAFLLGMVTNIYSQEKSVDARADKWTDWMKKTLTLNDDQASKVQAINRNYAGKIYGAKTDKGKSKQQKSAAMKQQIAAMDGELKGVLTDAQFKTYQSKRKEMMKEKREKRKGQKSAADSTSQ